MGMDIVNRLRDACAGGDECKCTLQEAADEIEKLRTRIESSPAAIMDTRDVLGICAPTEAEFPALYAIQGRRVRLVVDDETPNVGIIQPRQLQEKTQ